MACATSRCVHQNFENRQHYTSARAVPSCRARVRRRCWQAESHQRGQRWTSPAPRRRQLRCHGQQSTDGNLGQLSRFAATEAESTSPAQWSTAVDPRSYRPSGVQIDGFAIFGSAVLGGVILATGFGRILGLNAWWDAWLLRVRDRRRRKVIDARVQLEKRWEDEQGPGPAP